MVYCLHCYHEGLVKILFSHPSTALLMACDSFLLLHLAPPPSSSGTLSAQVRHPIWGEYASSLMQQGVSRPKVRAGG